jgi:hypothetical protein
MTEERELVRGLQEMPIALEAFRRLVDELRRVPALPRRQRADTEQASIGRS